jgi:N-dimethylarginine dimethylaminohydrolase
LINSLKPKIAISSLPKSGWWPDGITAYQDNDMMSNGAHPNQLLLKEEHLSLIKILKKYSLDIINIPFKKELEKDKKYDFVFMRDHFVCNTNKDVVMCNMKLSERMDEGEFVISNLENAGYNISFLNNDCIAEGGEFFYLPKENILLAGQCRNNLKGAEHMAEKLKVSQLYIIPSNGYHLDTSISPIFNNNYDCIGIICAKEVFNDKQFLNFSTICNKNNWDIIEVEHLSQIESIQFRTSMNSLSLPGLLIGSSALNDTKIIDFTSVNNIILDTTPASQFNLSGGSIHCLTNELF